MSPRHKKKDINKRYREDISIETIFIIFIPKTYT